MNAKKLSQLKLEGAQKRLALIEDGMEVPSTTHPVLRVTFLLKRQKEEYELNGVISFEMNKDGKLFFYTNGCGGAYWINDVKAILRVEPGYGVKFLSGTDDFILGLVH